MILSADFEAALDFGAVTAVMSPDQDEALAGAPAESFSADFERGLGEYVYVQSGDFEDILDAAPSPISSADFERPLEQITTITLSGDFDGELAGAQTTTQSADWESQLFDASVPIPDAEILVTEDVVNLLDGWWDEVYGGQTRTFLHSEPFAANNHILTMSNGDGYVREEEGVGLRIVSPLSDPGTPTGAGVYSQDVWLQDEQFRWAFWFEVKEFLGTDTSIPMFFFPDTEDRSSFTRISVYAKSLVGMEIVSLDGGTVLNLRMFYTDRNGQKWFWDGDEWKDSNVVFGRVYKDRTYLFHLERDDAFWRLEVHDLTTEDIPEVQVVAVELPLESVVESAGWIAFGDLVCGDPSHLNASEILVHASHRGKGPRESFVQAAQLPPFTFYTEIDRIVEDDFSRYSVSYHLTDGSNTFLPQFRNVEIPEDDNDLYVTLGAGSWGRLDKVSYEQYATTRLWWVISLANKVSDPTAIPPGTVLRIPSLSVISSDVFPEVSRA